MPKRFVPGIVVGCAVVGLVGTAAPVRAHGPCDTNMGGALRVTRNGYSDYAVTAVSGSGCPVLVTANQPWVHLRFHEYSPTTLPGEYQLYVTVAPNPGPDARTALVGTTDNGFTITQLGGIPRRNVASDFDGDGVAEPTVLVRDVGFYSVQTRMAAGHPFHANVTTRLGSAAETALMGDFDGDSRSEVAAFNPATGQWRWSPSSFASTLSPGLYLGPQVIVNRGGSAADVPVPADYDGDGITDPAFYRPSDRFWYIRQTATRTARYVHWGGGVPGEVPVPADYDGDGHRPLRVRGRSRHGAADGGGLRRRRQGGHRLLPAPRRLLVHPQHLDRRGALSRVAGELEPAHVRDRTGLAIRTDAYVSFQGAR